MLYQLDDVPPMGISVLLALQHILAAFAGIIAVPLVVCTALGFSVPQTSLVVSASIFVAGIATFIQSKGVGSVGARVPGMMGTDFTFVNPTIAVGYLVCIPLGLVDLSVVGDAAWVALPNIFAYGFHFDWASTLAFVPAYIVSTIGTVGIMMAIGQASGTTMSSKRVSGGVRADGVGSTIAGVFGAGPNTGFSHNVGLVALTKVTSCRVMIIAGIILAALGVFPKLSALISVMSQPVLGGAGVIMFGLVAAQGIKTLATINLGDRELLIVSVAFGLGIGVTVRPDMLANLPSALQMILSSGISTGTLAALLLNIILVNRKTKKETQ